MATGRASRPTDALAACRRRCWKYDWIIDLDVQKFFDTVPWDLVVRAVRGGDRLPAGCCCMSSGGWLRRCSTRTARLSSETRELRKDRRSRRSWRTCSCTTRSICGWPGSSRAARSSATPMMPSCTARAGGRRNMCWPGSPRGWRRWGYGFTPTRRGSSIARTATVGVSTSTSPLPSSGIAFRPREARRQGRRAVHLVLARDQPRGAQGQERPAPRTADPQAHRPVAGRSGAMAEPHHRRVDELLRPVLPVGVGSPPAARQHLPEALGWEEVQAAADLQAVQAVVDRAARTRARPVRPLAVGSRVLKCW